MKYIYMIKFNDEDIVLNNTILNDNKCLCCHTEIHPLFYLKLSGMHEPYIYFYEHNQ